MMGPVQMLMLGFKDPQFKGEALAELQKLRDADIIRVIDAMVVWKDEDGNVAVLKDTDYSAEDMAEFGGIVGGLIGLGAAGEEGLEAGAEMGAEAMEDGVFDEEEVWYAVDAIPPNTAAAIALFEHRWAIPFRDAIVRAGGFVLADEWIHPKDLVAVGLAAAEVGAAAPAEA